jgi:DNA repair protein RadC
MLFLKGAAMEQIALLEVPAGAPTRTPTVRRQLRPERYLAGEFKIIALHEQPLPTDVCETPNQVDTYWRKNIALSPNFNPDVESLYVLLLNRRNRVLGHHLTSQGTLDSLLCHPREVFRAAIIANASSIIITHNHPSGDPTPSSADISATCDLVRAGQTLKMDVLDHVIIGHRDHGSGKGFFSIRQSGLVAF